MLVQVSDFNFPAGRLGLRSDKSSKRKGSSGSVGPERDGMWKWGRGAEINRTRKHEEGEKKKKKEVCSHSRGPGLYLRE